MSETIDIIVRLLPYLIIAFVFIYIFHELMSFIKSRDKQNFERDLQLAKYNKVSSGGGTNVSHDGLIKLQLQAAERFALYLERISPDRLVMRLHQNGMSAKMLQSEMLRSIREEFDHNLSQQIYISEGAWELIRNSKEEMIKFITATGEGMKKESTGLQLSQKIFQSASKVERLPSDIAMEYLRTETRRLLP
jgi:hypothetical protein